MKLEVGMFVRTKNGMIAKIISKEDVSGSLHREEVVFILDNGNKLALHSRKVIKASYNIIDLIEVGDYVNGSEVLDFENKYIKENDEFVRFGVITENCYLENTDSWIIETQIKSIVTKEMYSSVEYRVETN